MSHPDPLRPAGGSPPKRTSGDVFRYMVTPDRIPEFIIPSLDIVEERRLFGKEKGLALSGDPPRVRPDHPTKEDCGGFWPGSLLTCRSSLEMDAGASGLPDPVAWAALSLPHLPKITTPYGFLALGESPHITKEEALFFRLDGASPGSSSTKSHLDPQVGQGGRGSAARPPGACMDVGRCPQSDPKATSALISCSSSGPVRTQWEELNLSDPTARTGVTDGPPKSLASLAATCPQSHSNLKFPVEKTKRNLFQKILKKHFAHLRNLS